MEGSMLVLMSAFAVLALDPTPPQLHRAPPAPVLTPARDGPAASPATSLSMVAVTLECTARASGKVENCKVLGETHPGLGFGDAAIALMRDAEVAPGPRDIQFARTIQFMP
jgi:TonB family protein